MKILRRAATGVMITGIGLTLSACGSDDLSYGKIAVWDIPQEADITAETQSFDIHATRVDCASGETGEIVDVDIESAENEIIIQAYAEPFEEEEADCPANESVIVEVDLGEPIGDRNILDGACEYDDAARTTHCDTDIRWPAPP